MRFWDPKSITSNLRFLLLLPQEATMEILTKKRHIALIESSGQGNADPQQISIGTKVVQLPEQGEAWLPGIILYLFLHKYLLKKNHIRKRKVLTSWTMHQKCSEPPQWPPPQSSRHQSLLVYATNHIHLGTRITTIKREQLQQKMAKQT